MCSHIEIWTRAETAVSYIRHSLHFSVLSCAVSLSKSSKTLPWISSQSCSFQSYLRTRRSTHTPVWPFSLRNHFRPGMIGLAQLFQLIPIRLQFPSGHQDSPCWSWFTEKWKKKCVSVCVGRPLKGGACVFFPLSCLPGHIPKTPMRKFAVCARLLKCNLLLWRSDGNQLRPDRSRKWKRLVCTNS